MDKLTNHFFCNLSVFRVRSADAADSGVLFRASRGGIWRGVGRQNYVLTFAKGTRINGDRPEPVYPPFAEDVRLLSVIREAGRAKPS